MIREHHTLNAGTAGFQDIASGTVKDQSKESSVTNVDVLGKRQINAHAMLRRRETSIRGRCQPIELPEIKSFSFG
ncbi:hypothetical protein HF086_012572 [Spodoptera exigua]|uniref:Uncharacterized protein n=1 Tax=Spodoptera exigua TaxID=7107 RepID=A0A922SAS2_SPOEX|nr:hypothetical protein HF086_012572 [Spodoptera exigua]